MPLLTAKVEGSERDAESGRGECHSAKETITLIAKSIDRPNEAVGSPPIRFGQEGCPASAGAWPRDRHRPRQVVNCVMRHDDSLD